MRLFVGLDLPYEMRRNLELLLALLKPQARIQWSPMENLHLTTKFIGEFEPQRLDALKAALAAIPRPGALRIAMRGLGWFPNPHQPRVLFAGIQAPAALPELARATGQACSALGVATETKEYRPHLTLARIRQQQDLFALQKTIAELPNTDFGAFQATAFHLYQSQPTPAGSVYTKLATFSLQA